MIASCGALIAIGAAVGCTRVAAPAEEVGVDAAALPLTCPIEARNDGKFTGWPATTECSEWAVEPLQGTYGKLYLDYTDDGTLKILNDWHLCTEEPPKDFYNLFQITTGGGTQHWMTRVMGTKVHVWLNGKKIGAFSRGAAGFGPSPTKAEDHTIYEFSLPDVAPGTIAMKLGDPGGAPFTTPEESIVMDPKGYQGVLQQGGGATLEATTGPMIVGVEPAVIAIPQQVALIGYDFGAAKGTVRIAGIAVAVASWTAEKVVFAAPELSNGHHFVDVRTADNLKSNVVSLQVACTAKCANNVCGDDGCGGSCGTCSVGQACQGGQCKCVGSCASKVCGDDGCGGSCGTCGSGQQCNFGACACAPSCAGKLCGDDGCGGTCGGCQGTAAVCSAGTCVCTPDCKDKQCGDDGCSGSCGGGCDKNEVCSAGQCVEK